MKSKLILFSLAVIVFCLAIFVLVRKGSGPEPSLRPTPIPTQMSVPTISQEISVTPQKSQTGVNLEEEKKYFESHPDLSIEANLRVSAPIQGEGFVVNFSYKTNSFSVIISKPYKTNYKNFQKWFQEKGLNDASRFPVTYQ